MNDVHPPRDIGADKRQIQSVRSVIGIDDAIHRNVCYGYTPSPYIHETDSHDSRDFSLAAAAIMYVTAYSFRFGAPCTCNHTRAIAACVFTCQLVTTSSLPTISPKVLHHPDDDLSHIFYGSSYE
jgi:hypothetical protein